MQEDRNDLAFWYPKIKAVVPTPRTHVLRTEIELAGLIDGETPDGFDVFCQQLAFAASRVKYPAFLRTGHTSGKHSWRSTCYLAAEADIPRQVAALVEESYLVDFFGLPVTTWAVREFLDGPVAFTAFNGLPIRQERRVFVRDGEVVCHHPYWPRASIERPSDPAWEQKLDSSVNAVSDSDLAIILTGSAAVAAVLPGAWSVDWMNTTRGWVVIDAAEAERSFHWEGCQGA